MHRCGCGGSWVRACVCVCAGGVEVCACIYEKDGRIVSCLFSFDCFLVRLSNVYGLYRCVGINLLLLEYRGYGLSQGAPSEEGLYLDAQAAVSYLKTRPDIDQNKIIIFGRSLGKYYKADVVSQEQEILYCMSCL